MYNYVKRMKMGNKIYLNIGDGATYMPGYVNIDIAPYADISLNLNNDKFSFEDNSVDTIFNYHTI